MQAMNAPFLAARGLPDLVGRPARAWPARLGLPSRPRQPYSRSMYVDAFNLCYGSLKDAPAQLAGPFSARSTARGEAGEPHRGPP